MAEMIRAGVISSAELIDQHLERIQSWHSRINAAVEVMAETARKDARAADAKLAAGEEVGPLHGVPFSIKDSMDVAGTSCTAGTLGRKNALCAERDATLVRRLRDAGAIPVAKTNLPDLLFSFETDNLIFGRTNNPYDLSRTPGGSSGGESALIASCGSPLGLGSDCAGSVRVPAAFCGITSIKPTSGRLPRTGHVPPYGGWVEKLWQIGPMARWTEDLVLAMKLLAGADQADFTALPVPLFESGNAKDFKIAFFTDNGIARCDPAVEHAVQSCAVALAKDGMLVEEKRPCGIDKAYDLEMAILGADGWEGVNTYLREVGSESVHPLLTSFADYTKPSGMTTSQLATRWAQWDAYRAGMTRFFNSYDAVLCPTYTQTALKHGESCKKENFEGFSYTMAWNVAGFPAATVRCGEADGLPINVQVVAKPWHELTALAVCRAIEGRLGGWKAPKE